MAKNVGLSPTKIHIKSTLLGLLSIQWYQFVSNAEVWWRTSQSLITSTIQSRHLSLFGHTARMDDNIDAHKIPFAFLWRTGKENHDLLVSRDSQNDLKSHNLTLTEALDMEAVGNVWRYAH